MGRRTVGRVKPIQKYISDHAPRFNSFSRKVGRPLTQKSAFLAPKNDLKLAALGTFRGNARLVMKILLMQHQRPEDDYNDSWPVLARIQNGTPTRHSGTPLENRLQSQ